MSVSRAFQSGSASPPAEHKVSAKGNRRPETVDVLHLAVDMANNPEAREVVDIAIQANRMGWSSAVASGRGPLSLEIERAAVRHIHLPLDKSGALARWRSAVLSEASVRRLRPALIHAHGFETLALACRISSAHGIPLLADLREPTPVTPYMVKLLKKAEAAKARFRVPSEHMVRHLRNDLGLSGDFLYYVPPGVDMVAFDPARMTAERLQHLAKIWRLPEQGSVIVTAAPLAPGFGQLHLLEAIAKIGNKDAFVVIVGDDRRVYGMREIIEKKVFSCGLEGRVVMPENCSDWPAACWLAGMMVAANGIPRGQAPELLAAQAMGRPVVVTDCGANREMVSDGETALVVPPDNVDAMAAALAEAMRLNVAQRTEMAVRARNFIACHFPQSALTGSVLEIYEAMLASFSRSRLHHAPMGMAG